MCGVSFVKPGLNVFPQMDPCYKAKPMSLSSVIITIISLLLMVGLSLFVIDIKLGLQYYMVKMLKYVKMPWNNGCRIS